MAGKFREHLRIRLPPQRGGAAWPRFRAVCARLGAPLGPGFQQRHGHQTDTCPSALQDAQYSWVSGPRSPDTYSEAHTRTLGSPATPPPCLPSRARVSKLLAIRLGSLDLVSGLDCPAPLFHQHSKRESCRAARGERMRAVPWYTCL